MFLDLDGTLAPIAETPTDVVAESGRTELLLALGEILQGRMAIVSGRAIDDIDRIVEGAVPAVAGLHGLERRTAHGSQATGAPHPGLEAIREPIRVFADRRPGVLVEDKTLAVALHYRQAPHAAYEVLTFARRLAWSTGLKLQEGRMVAELRTPGANKGDVVRAFMGEPPFACCKPIFVGDDNTDEDGFAAAHELGGVGVLVGEMRETAARAHLSDVPTVLEWLRNSLQRRIFTLGVTP